MSRVARAALVLLAFVAISFAATWATLPDRGQTVALPAALYASGLTHKTSGGCAEWSQPYAHEFGSVYRDCLAYAVGPTVVKDPDALRKRAYAAHGAAVAAIVLIGLAIGAGRKEGT